MSLNRVMNADPRSEVAELFVYVSLKASDKSATIDVVEAPFPLYDDVFRRAPGSSLRRR